MVAAVICVVCAVFTLERPVRSIEQQPAQSSFIQGQAVADETLQGLALQGAGALAAKPIGQIIAEGDSWFSYPGLDVLGALAGGQLPGGVRYRVYSAAKAGDTVEAMAYDGEDLEGFAAEFRKVVDAGAKDEVKAILLSGGGNDIAGPEMQILLNHASSAAGVLSPLDVPVVDAFIDRVGRSLESLIGTAKRFSEAILGRNDIPILIHGYAAPVPDGRPFLFGWPFPGPWLQPAFSAKGYVRDAPDDLARNTRVMADLIFKFNARVARIPGALASVADVRYVDLSKELTNIVANDQYKTDWANELHPRNAGFVRVAGLFHDRIQKK
jgi:lysophospholipase L1-like esterase